MYLSTITSLTKAYNAILIILSKSKIAWFILSNNQSKNMSQPLFGPYKRMIEDDYDES